MKPLLENPYVQRLGLGAITDATGASSTAPGATDNRFQNNSRILEVRRLGNWLYRFVNPQSFAADHVSFGGWGVVKTWFDGASRNMQCQTCRGSKGQCGHTRHVMGLFDDITMPTSMPAEDMKRALDDTIDYDVGGPNFKLTCISRAKLPEEPGDDPVIAAMCKGMADIRQGVENGNLLLRIRIIVHTGDNISLPCYRSGT